MKKIITLLALLFVTFSYGQNDTINAIPKLFNSVQSGYYKIYFNGVEQPENYSRMDKVFTAKANLKFFYPDAVVTHTQPSQRIDINKNLIPKDTVTVETIVYRDSIVEVETIVYRDSIVEVDKPFVPYSKDTTYYAKQVNKVFDSITNARYFSILYRPDSLTRHIKVISILAKDSIAKPLDCVECGVKDIKIRFRTFYDSPEEVRRVELEHNYESAPVAVESTFKFIESAIRSQDSLSTYTQTYFTEDWLFSKRESNDINNMGEWTVPAFNAGLVTNYVDALGVTHPIARRHSQTFSTKYYQIKAVNKITGEEIILDIQTNPFM